MTARQILVTSALPYANGHIHMGHLVEYLQTDIWVRFQKLRGRRCVYICADDTHGTAIMIRARQEGIREEELIAKMQQAHLADFAGFGIEFDNYGSTNSPETREVCEEIWAALRKADLVEEQEVTQLYDATAGTFLADRFVKGTCPKCNSPNQYGDSCDKCGTHYNPTDLIDPVSTLSGSKPELRKADHLFVNIEKLHGFLEEWTQRGEHLQPEIANYLTGHFLGEPLRDWDISRPAPYFGFEIPDSPGNYWYVWFDAPIGYIGSTKEWCQRRRENFGQWWRDEEKTEIHHFIGKDITYFHTLFWPAMLKTAGFSLPTKVHIHGFLTVNGEKMSKSKGTFIRASTYLEHLDPSYLRYYYASKLTSRVDDIDLNFEEFAAKVNADMVGNIVNLASRTAGFADQDGTGHDVSRRRRAVCSDCRRGPGHRRGLRRLRLCPGDSADSGGRRPGQPVRRTAGAVEPPQRPLKARRTPQRLHDRPEPVPPTGRVSGARVAAAGSSDGRVAGRSDRSLGPIAAAAAGHAGGQVHAHDAAGRSEGYRGDAGHQRGTGRGGSGRPSRDSRQRCRPAGRTDCRNHQLRRVRQG